MDNHPKRILIVNYEFPPLGGGAGTASLETARALARLGFAPVVLTTWFRELPREETIDGVEVHRVRAFRRKAGTSTPIEMALFILAAIRHAGRLVRQTEPTCLLCYFSIPSGVVGWWVRKRFGVPFIVLLRGGDVPGFHAGALGAYHRLTMPLTRLVWRRAAAVTTNSENLKALALRTMPGLEIPVIPNGVDMERFRPRIPEMRAGIKIEILRYAQNDNQRDAQYDRQGVGLNDRLNAVLNDKQKVEPYNKQEDVQNDISSAFFPESVTGLFVGRLNSQKGLDVLLRALGQIREQLPGGFRLALVGDGPDENRLRKSAADLGIEGIVEFRGRTPPEKIAETYRAANFFVLPSRDEGMPNVVLEAMASGLPVIATDIPGCLALVADGENGIIVPRGADGEPDAASLARAVARMATDTKLRRDMGRKSLERAAAFSWDATARRMAEIIRTVRSA